MKTPASPHFEPVDLEAYFNAFRDELDVEDHAWARHSEWSKSLRGAQSFHGIPFAMGTQDGRDTLVLRPGDAPVVIALPGVHATYLVFLQAVADFFPPSPPGMGNVLPGASSIEGNELGGTTSTYTLRYADGTSAEVPILRRFAIQQRHITWGASPFAAVPARAESVVATSNENFALGRPLDRTYGYGECRTRSERLWFEGENLWLYALPNPEPSKPIAGIELRAAAEATMIYGLSVTRLAEHPLRLRARNKLRLRLPAGVELNTLGELDVDDRADQIGMDLGTVISARAVLEYSKEDWLGTLPDVQPTKSTQDVIVEYSAHPDARLYLRAGDGALSVFELRSLQDAPVPDAVMDQAVKIAPALRTTRFRIVEKDTGRPVAARLHVHGPHGEYLPPHGFHRKVNADWYEDRTAEFANDLNQYAYVDGTCEIDLPIGRVFVDISKGHEIRPLRRIVEVDADTEVVTFELEKVLRWREEGWVTSDTHVHFLSPQTALLEGQAEGVNVVNLLAAQWGEMFSNVGDFDGRTTLGAKDFGGDGEFLVRVGTENRMQVLGHVSLLGYEGEMIGPLSAGGPDEAAIGDRLETTMADWAERCRRQGGLVVTPHAPNPQAERAANIVLGMVDALEMMSFNPRQWQISSFGLADWYRFLNIGHHLPLVAGSDKMSAASLLGGIRTYAHMNGREFTYKNWMEAVRGGDTFATVGPLVRLRVEGRPPGATIRLPGSGGSLAVTWKVESVSVPPLRVEIVKNGQVHEEIRCDGLAAEGSSTINVRESCWIAVRVRGSVCGRDGDIAAHTSAVMVEVGEAPIFATTDAVAVLAQIEGSIAYLDTLAPRSDEAKQARMRATLELAHHRLHHRLHQAGATHDHTPVHSVHLRHEH